uniref:Uncharacterized protein n=1 Tax=Onchocerca volvulus TaxID=6282 RepID=A0A8R1XXQ1_ONCVO
MIIDGYRITKLVTEMTIKLINIKSNASKYGKEKLQTFNEKCRKRSIHDSSAEGVRNQHATKLSYLHIRSYPACTLFG